ncbi:MAG TPA: OmpA family protein [Chondromyces sp.]|nr:OmpA family protein [Chondromyces sp.]
MRKIFSPALAVVLVLGLSLTGCATKKFVDEQISAHGKVTQTKIHEVQTSVEANQKEISDLAAKQAALEADVAKLSETAKDALKRAEEAGKLAKGRFVFEVTLTENDVQFGFDKAVLTDAGKAVLDDFAAKVKGLNHAFVEIQGHTDSIGSESYNLKLGHQRAEAAMRYLVEQGVPLFRMNVISYGEFKPIADNSTKEGRAQNRRVTLIVME